MFRGNVRFHQAAGFAPAVCPPDDSHEGLTLTDAVAPGLDESRRGHAQQWVHRRTCRVPVECSL